MATDPNISGDYFDTPARAERLQLLLHLVRNAGEVLYLRAPAGSGKTRFAHQLLDILGDEMATVWIQADAETDVPMAAVDQLGLAAAEVSPWPDAVMSGLAGQDLLTIVDNADRLGLEAVESLALMHARGGRLLLVGQGGLARTNGNWDVQFVDLPPFDAVQTTAFLRTQAGDHAIRVTDDLAAGLHRAAKGLPGPLLDALNGVLGNTAPSERASRVDAAVADGPRGPVWPWAFGGLALILLLSVLLFQDQINALFTPPGTRLQPPTVTTTVDDPPVVAPEMAPQAAARDDARAEAVSALMPEMGLPEPEPATAEARIDAMPTAAGPVPEAAMAKTAPEPLSATIPDATVEAPAADLPTDPPKDPPKDPLEEVMQDALAAQVEAARPDADPLDAVMQDALAAAKADESGVEPAVRDEPATPAAEPEAPAAVPAPSPAPSPAPEQESTRPAADTSTVTAQDPAPDPKPAVVVTGSDSRKPAQREAGRAPGQEPPPVPAPVETRTPAPISKPVVKPKTAPAADAADTGVAWLKARPPGRYTLQLVGSRDRGAVRKFVRDYGIEAPFAIFERDLKGKPWYSLVAGDYPDRDAAIAARARLPKRLERSGVWPRTFESIQKSM